MTYAESAPPEQRIRGPRDRPPGEDDRRAKRNVAVLVAAQAIMGAQMPICFVLGGLAGHLLAENKLLATLPISMIVLVSMFAAPAISLFMGRRGRKAGFMIGVAGGAIGAAISIAALYVGSFWLLCLGYAFVGLYMGAQGMFRFAATDTASPAFRPKAISYVMAGGLVAAVLGPELVKLFRDSLAPVPFAGAFVAVIVLNVIGVGIVLMLDLPKPEPRREDAPSGRPLREILADPRAPVAIICAMVSYALMNLMMTATPLAVVGCGFSTDDAATVVQFHVVAMFAPSFFTGHLIARFGVERIIAIGLAILFAAGLVALSGVEIERFYVALTLLGIGWNFGFIGGTTMLAATHAPEERAKVQGLNDFLVFGLVVVASFSSGGLLNSGADVVEGWRAVNYAMVPFLALAGGALVWLSLRRRAA